MARNVNMKMPDDVYRAFVRRQRKGESTIDYVLRLFAAAYPHDTIPERRRAGRPSPEEVNA